MKRGKKPIYDTFANSTDFLLHCTERPYWKEHHKYECKAILELIEENRRLKLPWDKRKRK